MKCPQCQHENPDAQKFCGECGQKLGELPETEKTMLETEGERKHVTIMFSDLSGYTAMTEKLDPEEVKEIMSLIFGEITEIVHGYDGFIEKFIGDAVMAVFGVPKAHEDDPIRAIRAALEIHAAVESFSPQFEGKIGRPLTMHTGINTGLVVTGEVDVEKGAHGLTGDAINLASRLEGIAKAGEIVVGPDTYNQAVNYFEFETMEPTKIKGKQTPVSIYKIQSSKKVSFKTHRLQGLQAVLTGRNKEMTILAEAAERLIQGQGSIISICGDAGTGKSRLKREFKNTLDLANIQWREGHAYGYTQNTPYYPLINLLTHAFQIDEGDPPEAIRTKVETGGAYLLDEGNTYIPYIGSLFALTYSEIEGVSPEYWKDKLRESIQAILSALVDKGPTIVCFEDLHWADPSFIELLKRLVVSTHRKALFICTYRSHFTLFDNDLPDDFRGYYQEIRLKDLATIEAQEMLKSLLDTQSMPAELYEVVRQKAEGNPFYIEEMINSLIESEILTRDNGSWKLARKITETDIPSTIQGVLTARVDRLGKHFKRILQEASVIGRAFLFKILERITDIDSDIDQYLAGLEGLDLIRTQLMEPELEYIFKHALTQEVVYSGLLKKERQAIHERIGLTIEQLFSDRLPEFYETLAYHFGKGRSVNKAVDYLMQAGQKNYRKFALEEAHQSFQQAYDLLFAKPQQIPNRDAILIKMLTQWPFVFYFRADYGGIHRLLSVHEKTALKLNDRATVAMFLAWLGWSHFGIENYRVAEEYFSRALEIGEEIQDSVIIAYVYTWRSWNLATLGKFDEAISFGNKAFQLAQTFKLDQYLHFKSRAGIAHAYWHKGDRLKSLEEGKNVVAFGESRGSIPALTFGYTQIGISYLSDGDFAKAIEWLERVVSEQKDFVYYYASLALQGICFFMSGENEKAQASLQTAIDFLLEDSRFPWLARPAELFLGGVWIAKGRMNNGMQKIRDAQNKLFKTNYKYFYNISEYLLGSIYLRMALGEGEISFSTILKNIGFLVKNLPFAAQKAERHLKRTIELAEEIGAKGIQGQAWFDLGRLYKAKKNKEDARKCFAKAIEVFELCKIETFKKHAKDALEALR